MAGTVAVAAAARSADAAGTGTLNRPVDAVMRVLVTGVADAGHAGMEGQAGTPVSAAEGRLPATDIIVEACNWVAAEADVASAITPAEVTASRGVVTADLAAGE